MRQRFEIGIRSFEGHQKLTEVTRAIYIKKALQSKNILIKWTFAGFIRFRQCDGIYQR